MKAPGHPVIPIHGQDEPSRRRFLKLMAASAALAGAGCSGPPAETIVPYVRMPEQDVPGLPLFYASAFVRRGFAHGVLVETNMGRPTKVEGNPEHPVSAGTTDVFTQASILQMWDPDRSQTVQQRVEKDSELSTWAAFEAALEARRPHFARDGGAGLRILTGAVTSPTLAAQLAALQQKYPAMRWHAWDPLHDDGAAAAADLAFGRPLDALYRLDRVAVLLTLDADLFGAEGSHGASLAHARAFTAPRRLGANVAANRLYAMESTPTLTGAYADERLARAPHEIEAALWRIAGMLGAAPGGSTAADAAGTRWEAAVAKALRDARGRALVVAGPTLSPASRALVHLLNQRLGAQDGALAYIEPVALGAPAHGAALAELSADMQAGRVDTLLMLDANPVYAAPPALGFAQALRRVPLSAHLGLYRDETAREAGWHLPLAHCYEAWSDARASDGTASIVQPMIAPLYGGRSAHALLAIALGEGSRDGHALVRATWQAARPGQETDAFDAAWREALRRGLVPDSAAPPVAVRTATAPAQPAPVAPPLVARFAPDPAVDGGEFSNNAWLQELPRPLSSLTWDNAALVGPATAKRAGLADGDIVRLELDGRTLEAPVLVLAEQAEGAVTLPLGYGRSGAGSVGNGVGFNAYRLRAEAAMGAQDASAPLGMVRTGRSHEFALRQREVDMHGRDPVKVTEVSRPVPRKKPEEEEGGKTSLYPERSYDEYKWGMAIDLNACIGCASCTVACQAENNIPVVGKEEVIRGRSMHWIRVDRYRTGRRTLFQPVPCMHCEHAPCEEVCPVGATVHDDEGLNVQVYNRCIGTRFCSNNCPYKVRRFNFLQYSNEKLESLKALQNPEVTVRKRGVMEKCSYCLQRITRARIDAEKQGRPIADGEVVTACQAACPTAAIHFGDLNDPRSAVVAAKASKLDYVLLEELNTRPRTSYAARVVNPDPELG
ncbi:MULTISPECIES: 4Fe-4S dicluster domain-containing protein [unclassified Massilia]|uniref:4Fe-4S dicluster domain-containing protein n=1 Tax=unclassified Massilia TaxID=2609279 RepID=UPI000B0CFF34|nr:MULTISPECIES: 4Fe-4S dicluster domain-containing protein [unclassified Massilia]